MEPVAYRGGGHLFECYNGVYYIYVTKSCASYSEQLNIDAFSSRDLVHWKKHKNIVDMSTFPYVHKAVWAPTIAKKSGKYYLMFAVNDIQSDNETGGIVIAVSESPTGPFTDYLGKPIIDKFINSAQPIDAHLFSDGGTVYLYYGGWGHCNAAVMRGDMKGFVPLDNGRLFKSITPSGYTEGPCMLKRNNKYYFMYSQGNWTNGTYKVLASCSDSPLNINPHGKVILKSSAVADGPGHNSYINIPGTDDWRIVYHRRITGDCDAGHRVLCIDKLTFSGDEIDEIKMT